MILGAEPVDQTGRRRVRVDETLAAEDEDRQRELVENGLQDRRRERVGDAQAKGLVRWLRRRMASARRRAVPADSCGRASAGRPAQEQEGSQDGEQQQDHADDQRPKATARAGCFDDAESGQSSGRRAPLPAPSSRPPAAGVIDRHAASSGGSLRSRSAARAGTDQSGGVMGGRAIVASLCCSGTPPLLNLAGARHAIPSASPRRRDAPTRRGSRAAAAPPDVSRFANRLRALRMAATMNAASRCAASAAHGGGLERQRPGVVGSERQRLA